MHWEYHSGCAGETETMGRFKSAAPLILDSLFDVAAAGVLTYRILVHMIFEKG